MLRSLYISVVILLLSVVRANGRMVVADSLTRMALPSASVFDNRGNVIGICNTDGSFPYVSESSYPLIVRYLGYKDKVVGHSATDTIFMQENMTELPEVIIQSDSHRVLHMLAYIREYSTLSTYTDTVFLFREKMVDYMLTSDPKVRFKGWSVPRVLKSKSYYRFTDAMGTDSVSDQSSYHFSWSDWIGVAPSMIAPPRLISVECGNDTVFGKYRLTELWTKKADKITVDVDVLEDTTSRKWVANLNGFFKEGLDFENFNLRFNYDNIVGDAVLPMDLTGYSYNIESKGRGHGMFMFNRINEPFFVSTYAEVYMLDKEFITVKEAKKWDKFKFSMADFDIIEPQGAPELHPFILSLIDRVGNVDKEGVRIGVIPDHRLAGRKTPNRNFSIAYRALDLLKQLTGITYVRTNRNLKRNWREFTKEQIKTNNRRQKKK